MVSPHGNLLVVLRTGLRRHRTKINRVCRPIGGEKIRPVQRRRMDGEHIGLEFGVAQDHGQLLPKRVMMYLALLQRK